jgi:hypothetical protein
MFNNTDFIGRANDPVGETFAKSLSYGVFGDPAGVLEEPWKCPCRIDPLLP